MQPSRPPGGRQLKKQVRELLRGQDWTAGLTALQRIPPRRAVNPLFSFFYSDDLRTRPQSEKDFRIAWT